MGPPGSGGGRGPPGSGSGRGPPCRSGSRRGPPPRSGGGRGPPPGKDQTRPAEKYCWESGRYTLEKRLSCFVIIFIKIMIHWFSYIFLCLNISTQKSRFLRSTRALPMPTPMREIQHFFLELYAFGLFAPLPFSLLVTLISTPRRTSLRPGLSDNGYNLSRASLRLIN